MMVFALAWLTIILSRATNPGSLNRSDSDFHLAGFSAR